jgi:hypothetical protein
MPTFSTPEPEKRITMEITAKEAHLIKVLREIQFGEVIIKKMNGALVRIEPKVSILLDEKIGLEFSAKGV